jgi:hypothetical protein
MEALDTYTSVLAVLSAALLLVAAGLAKKQLVRARVRRVTAPLRQRRS